MKYMMLVLAVTLTLAGCSNEQKAEAGNKAQHAKEQTRHAVQNARQALSNSAITAKVKTAMLASDKLQTGGINIDTKNGVVHIRGTVPDASQKTLAERIARDTVGSGIAVICELQIKPAPKPTKAH